ncbi:membrane protein [Planctomycetales bacterium]|nr:membrane protein [Planctomycetales bacterium]
MLHFLRSFKSKNIAVIAITTVLCGILLFVNLYPNPQPDIGTKERAKVLSVDDSGLMTVGLVQQGTQKLEVEVQSGRWKGTKFQAHNQLRAQMDLDKIFKPGDTVLVAVLNDADPKTSVIYAQDHYRIGYTLLLFGLFAVCLLIFGGTTGACALLSFVFTCLVIWKLVVPLCLLGWSAIAVCFTAVTIFCAVIIFLVAGVSRKGFAAFSGAFLGVLASCLTAYLFTYLFNISGAVMPYSSALLYSGFERLSLSDIYIGAIFLSSSGAVMDLAMDVATGMQEVADKQPNITRSQLLGSGLTIGRAVVGTMTTTLLLAYSGGYLTLMMMFAAQGTTPTDFMNNPYVASESVKTLVGSFGLVLVAPFTAITGVFLFNKNTATSETHFPYNNQD